MARECGSLRSVEGGEVMIRFPVKCNVCRREIPDGAIYYAHPALGFVCEYCPQFNDGQLKIHDDDEDSP